MAANTKKKKRVKIKMPPHSMEPVDAIPVPDYIPPEPEVGETLLEILKTRRLEDEREFLGEKLSGRALHNLTPQEIRDLRDVFKVSTRKREGFQFRVSRRVHVMAFCVLSASGFY